AAEFRTVGRRNLVEDLRLVLQRLEAMGETAGCVEHHAVLCIELGREPAPVGRGGGTQIDDHVEDAAPYAADQLRLGPVAGLVMESPQCSLMRVERGVALAEVRVEAEFGELARAPGAG